MSAASHILYSLAGRLASDTGVSTTRSKHSRGILHMDDTAPTAQLTGPGKYNGQKLLVYGMLAVVAFHAILLLAWNRPQTASRCCTAALVLLAALCAIWRGKRLSRRERASRERVSWWWLSAGLLLWASAQFVEVFVGHSTAASNLAADPSDFLYLIVAFPLLIAIASTSETESVGGLFLLDISQVALAVLLTYIRLFDGMSPAVMARMYAAECVLLAIAATVRLASWSTLEERRRMRLACAMLWMYLVVEVSLDYATQRWGLKAGTLLDLLWSAPFFFAGWQMLRLPFEENTAAAGRTRNRTALLLESLCPLLMNFGVFALAASLLRQHPALAIASMVLLLLLQGLHSGVVQLSYVQGKRQLLEQERELKEANDSLRRLSLIDPLTGISNRRRFTSAFEVEWKRALRRQEPIAILMIDIDFFKGVNDLHAHAHGDDCLVRVAHALRGELRADDLLARYGGEEFILLLPRTDLAGAETVAKRMQLAVDGLRLINSASTFDRRLTVSIGVSATRPEPGIAASALIAAADHALYAAKRQGRNTITARACAAVPA